MSAQSENSLLIVGGSGFIGRHLTLHAIEKGFNVSILVTTYPEKPLSSVEYLLADIGNIQSLKQTLKGKKFSYVVNLGGYIDHSSFSQKGEQILNTHLTGTMNLVSLLRSKDLIHFVQIGSSDEYGSNMSPQHEDLADMPFSFYSFAKSTATRFLKMMNDLEDFPVSILRLFLVYGPGQDSNRFIPQAISDCLDGDIVKTSPGDQIRDFCYVEDIARGIVDTLLSSNSKGQIINLASGVPVTIKQVVNLIIKLTGSGTTDFGFLPYREGENMSLYADISKANELLNWKPLFSLEKGLKKTIASFRAT